MYIYIKFAKPRLYSAGDMHKTVFFFFFFLYKVDQSQNIDLGLLLLECDKPSPTDVLTKFGKSYSTRCALDFFFNQVYRGKKKKKKKNRPP